MRIGTIADLRIETLLSATLHPSCPELMMISVGPGAKPKVNTKGGVTGVIYIPKLLRDTLIDYFYSISRVLRGKRVSRENDNLVFVTKHGNPYLNKNEKCSSSINVLVAEMRKRGLSQGIKSLKNFHFHQSRCTFATEIARLAISIKGPINAIQHVKMCLLHKNEETSMKYIKFLENEPIKNKIANEFTNEFMGINNFQNIISK
jgi:integrase